MRCRVCGYEIPEQARFCRQCGTKVEDMFGQTEDIVEEHTSDPDQDLQSGPPLKNEEKQDNKKKLIIIAVGAVILLLLGVLLGINLMDKDASGSSGAPMDYYDEDYGIADDYDDSYGTTDDYGYDDYDYDDYSESNYQPPQNHSYGAEVAVSDYLDAYIEDIQYGAYNKLYSVVERGSNMEKTQEKFISSCNLYEELLGFTYIDTIQIDSSTYHVSTTERYDVYSYESDVKYYVEQKCVYVVREQADGNWKVADYAEQIEQLEKYVY